MPAQDAFLAVALAEPAGRQHARSIGGSPPLYRRFTAALRRAVPRRALFDLAH